MYFTKFDKERLNLTDSNGRTAIFVALIGLVGTITTALFTNWDKISPLVINGNQIPSSETEKNPFPLLKDRETPLSCQDINANSEIRVSDGNKKVIKSNGDFWVNGEFLARGEWISDNRYAVFVERWGSIWWIGDLTPDGMLVTTTKLQSQLHSVKPKSLERFIC
jgi:hypothetical protein